MQQSQYGEEMLDLMEMASEITEADKDAKEKGISVGEVYDKALDHAQKIFGKKCDKRDVYEMAMKATKKANNEEDAIAMVHKWLTDKNSGEKNEAKQMGYSGQGMETSGPGAKTRSTRNDYTRKEVNDMLQYAQKFVKDGKQVKSWKYSQDWLNAVGNSMRQFININSGDPALDYEPGKMQGDAEEWGYKPNKHGQAKADAEMKGNGPGPQRGSKMSTDYDINKRRSTKRSTRTDYNK